jgi:hypothetical protein
MDRVLPGIFSQAPPPSAKKCCGEAERVYRQAGSPVVSALMESALVGLMLLAGYGLKISEITDFVDRVVQKLRHGL